MLKVKFKIPTIKNEAGTFVAFCHPRNSGWDWSAKIYKEHPELEVLLRNKTHEDFYRTIYKYANAFIRKNKNELNKLTEEYQYEWDKIGSKYIKVLSNHFNTDYPINKKTISAYISIVPIFPRSLDEWAFNVNYKNPEYMIPISMHEILHFLYFKKWMEVFPKTKIRELDSPHLVWKLSEILAPIIINNNKDIQKLFRHKQGQYSEFQNVEIEKKKIPEHFENLYMEHLRSSQPFDEFLKTCWESVLRHRKTIEGI